MEACFFFAPTTQVIVARSRYPATTKGAINEMSISFLHIQQMHAASSIGRGPTRFEILSNFLVSLFTLDFSDVMSKLKVI